MASSYGSFSNQDDTEVKVSSGTVGQLIEEAGKHGENDKLEEDEESSLLPINVNEGIADDNEDSEVQEKQFDDSKPTIAVEEVHKKETEGDSGSSNNNNNNNNNNNKANTKLTSGEIVIKYKDKLKRLATKYKMLIKDRDDMQNKYEKYISELRSKLKRSNEAGKKYKAEYQELLLANKNNSSSNNSSVSASSLISSSMRNPLNLVKAAVSHTTTLSSSSSNSDKGINDSTSNTKNDETKSQMQELTAKNGELKELVEKLKKDIIVLKNENMKVLKSHDTNQENHLRKIELLEQETLDLKALVTKKDTSISKLKKTVRVKIEQLDDFEKTKGRLQDLESSVLTNVDNLARVTNDKKMLEDQLKQVYKSKNDLEQTLQDLREKVSKQNKSKSKILSEAKLKSDQLIDAKQIELDIARKEMLSMLNTTEAAEERARNLLEEKKKLQKTLNDLQQEFQQLQQHLEQMQTQSTFNDKPGLQILSTPEKNNKNGTAAMSPLGTPQSTPRSPYNADGEKGVHADDHAIDTIRRKHQKALQKISEQRSRFLQAAAEKAGFQSEMSALSARVKLQEIQLEQMRQSQDEKEQHALRKQDMFEEKAKELVQAAAKRKKELADTRKALMKMKQAYSALQDALNRGGIKNLNNINGSTGANGKGVQKTKSSNSPRNKRPLAYPKTGELGPFLTTIENLWEQLQYCDYSYMLSTRRYRSNSPKHVLQISSNRLNNAEQCINALGKVFEQNISSISSLLPISGHRKMSTPVQKLVNLLLCFSSEIVKLRKRVNDYTEALLDDTFVKSDKFENEWNEQKVLVSVDVASIVVDNVPEKGEDEGTTDLDTTAAAAANNDDV
jgi:hypothetical protein